MAVSDAITGYIPNAKNADWNSGSDSTRSAPATLPTNQYPNTPHRIPHSEIEGTESLKPAYTTYKLASEVNKETNKHTRELTYSSEMSKEDPYWAVHTPYPATSENAKREMYNLPIVKYNGGKRTTESHVQNQYGYPTYLGTSNATGGGMYNYIGYPATNIDKSSSPVASLETRLAQARASLGLQVHGDTDIARSVKYYMYNRFKVPDTNLAFNKSFTHVFFTRPDLYLLSDEKQISSQAMTHTETAMIYRRHPDLFKLLTDHTRCGDPNNFNMLLSNQIASFTMKNEDLNTLKVGKSWNDHQIMYGSDYTGRTADQFSCTFTETKDFSVTTLIKLWMTYIDNVSRGAFIPNYGTDPNKVTDFNHVHTRTLDYASSCYVFITGEDGEDILYWSKYYGIFPISNGASALSWEAGEPNGTPRLDVTFAYSWKLDLNPISLIEFNYNAAIDGGASWDQSFNYSIASSSKPFVTCPYVEFSSLTKEGPTIAPNVTTSSRQTTGLRLKYVHKETGQRRDDVLFKARTEEELASAKR